MSHEHFLNEFKKNHPDREVIFLMVAGSHFFDLNGPKSDHVRDRIQKIIFNLEAKKKIEYLLKKGDF
jgi:hypothetical protein